MMWLVTAVLFVFPAYHLCSFLALPFLSFPGCRVTLPFFGSLGPPWVCVLSSCGSCGCPPMFWGSGAGISQVSLPVPEPRSVLGSGAQSVAFAFPLAPLILVDRKGVWRIVSLWSYLTLCLTPLVSSQLIIL